jgi:hypothetical protein
MILLEKALPLAKDYQDKLTPLDKWLDVTEKRLRDLEMVPTDESLILVTTLSISMFCLPRVIKKFHPLIYTKIIITLIDKKVLKRQNKKYSYLFYLTGTYFCPCIVP